MAGFLESLQNFHLFDNQKPVVNGVEVVTPYDDLGALNKFNLVLSNLVDPTTIPKYEEKAQLSKISSDPRFAQLPVTEQLRQYAQVTGDISPLAKFSQDQVITPFQQAQLSIDQQQVDNQRRAIDARGGSGLPQTQGLPTGYQWVADPTTGQPVASQIPGVMTTEQKDKMTAAETKANSAVSFLQKISEFDNALTGLGDAGGTIEGSPLYRQTVGALNPFGGNESKRQLFDQLVASSELDIAQQQLKGQGSVTDTERQIARNKLPSVTDVNTATSRSKLAQLTKESINSVDAVNPKLAERLREQYSSVLNYDPKKSGSGGWKATVIK